VSVQASGSRGARWFSCGGRARSGFVRKQVQLVDSLLEELAEHVGLLQVAPGSPGGRRKAHGSEAGQHFEALLSS
jgi:hypothetical protein